LQAVLRLAPLTMLANGLNAALVVGTFWSVSDHAFLLLWALGIAGVVARGLRVGWLLRRRDAKHSASRRAMRLATLHASTLAVLWAMVPLVLFPRADGAHQSLVAIITSGMMGAGGFALATTPMAGTAYVLILGGGAAGALFRAVFPLAWPVGGLLLIYACIVVASVWSTARLFGARLMAEAEAERQNEVISLLMRDFEENASDVLWEIGSDGRLCRVSPRLAALFAVPVAELTAVPVLEMLQRVATEEDGSGRVEAIGRHLRNGTPFRNLPLTTTRDGRTRWWSLTAKPLHDADGQRTGWRGVAANITKAQRANRRLTWLAQFDPLTGLANRQQFRSQLAELLAPGLPATQACAVLCLDLDHFKAINDTLGQAVGDGLLQEVARRLLACTRRTDTVARLAGDEFAIILRDVSSVQEAEQLTGRLLESLQAPCEARGARVAVRASIGVAMAPRDGSDTDALLNHAFLALKAAKSAGRGDFRLFAPQMAAVTRRRLLIEQALRDALARGELSLAFQPQVDLTDWRVTGFEALLRWSHAELGDISPAEFVPVAEHAGLIQAIGQWVLVRACREAARWPDGLIVSVNVSPAQVMSRDLCRISQAALRDSGLAPERLELEITESIFMNETDATMLILHSLHDAGMRIALDDFGTGYSSLAYLRRFPFDTLKIDRSFVREIMSLEESRAIVKMIIDLAHTLDMRTVAEGVDEPAQVSVLGRYSCNTVQGYLVARPMPADQVSDFLAGWGSLPRPGVHDAKPTELLPLANVA
jgi:diguanylate cyclase (GGDEF)-like protein/PAS domain S-box-containing protein